MQPCGCMSRESVTGSSRVFRARTQPSLAIAAFIASVTARGCEIMITCDPSTSVISAPARFAIERMTSVPAARSPVATTAQEGSRVQAGGPDGSENPGSETGRCVAAIKAACRSERSPAKALRARPSWNYRRRRRGPARRSAGDPRMLLEEWSFLLRFIRT